MGRAVAHALDVALRPRWVGGDLLQHGFLGFPEKLLVHFPTSKIARNVNIPARRFDSAGIPICMATRRPFPAG